MVHEGIERKRDKWWSSWLQFCLNTEATPQQWPPPWVLTKLTSQFLSPESCCVPSTNAICVLQQCVIFAHFYKMVVLLCCDFFNRKRVKWNRKYLPWEHAEWDSTWVMLRTGDWRAMGLKTDRVAGCTQSFVSGWHSANTHGHHLMDVMLPPVDMWTALYSLIFKGLYGVVYMFPRGHRITYLPELAEQGMESIPPIARGSPSTPSIYILVSGKVARMKLSAFLYIWDFCI